MFPERYPERPDGFGSLFCDLDDFRRLLTIGVCKRQRSFWMLTNATTRIEGFPRRPPLYVGFFQCLHNARGC